MDSVFTLYAHSTRRGGLLFGHDFVKLIEDAFVSCEVERLVSDFKKMQDMILFISLYKLQRG